MSKNKLYLFIIAACLTGFSYLFYSIHYSKSTSLSLCMVKNVTGYPCPSCGTTRAIQLLLKNNWMASLQMNPFGILVALLMVVLPLWIVSDTITKKETFFNNYQKAEAIIRTKKLAFFLIILVIFNWIWNIKKGL
ncbi:DUF2752 domain-containing protein [Flavobacterium sp.]|jgi:hypothetical protein|uniref:DUF2752 domain-containing protein n=1 Tax=Flavobacterium sp. TaxID=239 RepID=UPI0037BF9D10